MINWEGYTADREKRVRVYLSDRRGEGNMNAKLTLEMVREILKLGPDWRRYAMAARQYGVNRRTIKDILQRKTWKHV